LFCCNNSFSIFRIGIKPLSAPVSFLRCLKNSSNATTNQQIQFLDRIGQIFQLLIAFQNNRLSNKLKNSRITHRKSNRFCYFSFDYNKNEENPFSLKILNGNILPNLVK